MDSKPLLYGLIGFFIGGLLVSIAATTLDKPRETTDGMSMSIITENLKDKKGDAFDAAFISAMIEHHVGAIEMAKLVQDRAKHGELNTLAGDIMSSQSKEIDMMQTWQSEWGYNTRTEAHSFGPSAH